jgi:hypothetical protein
MRPVSLDPARLLLRLSADVSVSPEDADEPVSYEADVHFLTEDFDETTLTPSLGSRTASSPASSTLKRRTRRPSL